MKFFPPLCPFSYPHLTLPVSILFHTRIKRNLDFIASEKHLLLLKNVDVLTK